MRPEVFPTFLGYQLVCIFLEWQSFACGCVFSEWWSFVDVFSPRGQGWRSRDRDEGCLGATPTQLSRGVVSRRSLVLEQGGHR